MTSDTAISIPVWCWRDAVRKADVPPLTKLVLYTIATYLNDCGKGCFPGIKAIMRDTGLSNTSIATHIKIAIAAGLLIVERQVGADGRYLRTIFKPRFPDNCELPRTPAEDEHSDGSSQVRVKKVHTAKPGEAGSRGRRNRVKEVHSDRPGEAGSHGPGEPGDGVHVNLTPDTLEYLHRDSSTSPLAPQGAERGSSSIEQILQAVLLGQPHRQFAVDHVFRPLLAARTFKCEMPGFVLGQLGDWIAKHKFDAAQADAIVAHVKASQDFTFLPGHLENAIKAISLKPKTSTATKIERRAPRDRSVAACWPRMRDVLVGVIGLPMVEAWFNAAGLDCVDSGELVVAAGHKFLADQIRREFLGPLLHAAKKTEFGDVRRIRVIADAVETPVLEAAS